MFIGTLLNWSLNQGKLSIGFIGNGIKPVDANQKIQKGVEFRQVQMDSYNYRMIETERNLRSSLI